MSAEKATGISGELESLKELLKQRFPDATSLDPPSCGILPSGIVGLDALLPGGLPRGALSLLSGGVSCGKTGLALAFAAELTRQGGKLAWLHQGAFSAPSAWQAGVDLEGLLAVQVDSFDQARRCADFLLRWQAFELVVLDWPGHGGSAKTWSRLHRLVTGSSTILLVITPELPPGDPLRYCASLSLLLERREGRTATSLLLEKSRYGRAGESTELDSGHRETTFELLSDLPGLGQDWHDEVG
ncbi:MAG: ATPase domain-containing protein [Myxococcota bacterium]|nr:ATPase domain-containing protein [Myxococcota bacterium]